MVRYCSALMLFWATMVSANDIPPLYQKVARNHGIPEPVLYSLAYGESQVRLQSGRIRPWPWTLNVKGQAYHYPSYEEACQALNEFLNQTQLVDIGLTQHNWYWQKAHFSTPCEAFFPEQNLNHAAKVMLEGYAKYKSWVKAAGYFHRPAGGEPAKVYEARFARILKRYGVSK